ncbi:MAG TPA: hypothetical protein VFG39_06120 [Balneolaceae bacterium]|nr:hypothetical protein [Balneolaceae bacterium]
MWPNKVNYFFCLFLAFTIYPQLSFAQYFGRNSVQYEDFDFQVLHTKHFDIYHYPREAQAIEDLGRLAERWYDRHSTTLHHQIPFNNPLIIYANHADFQQNDIVPRVGIGTGGVTEGRRNRVIMPFTQVNASTNHVLGHELVHAFQYDIARQDFIGGIRATGKLPLWFIEGMAEYLSLGPISTQTAMYLRDAVYYDDIPAIKDLKPGSGYFIYRYGHALWAYIAGVWGDGIVDDLFIASAKNGLKLGFAQVLKLSVDSVSTLWQNAVREKYANDVRELAPPDSVGKLIRGKSEGSGRLNVAPSLSPNGELMVFVSEKNLFSLELYLANAKTGEIIRKLTSTARSPHLSAIRFIESSGSWSPDGKKFAAAIFAEGDNRIAIIDIDDGGVIREIAFEEVEALSNPAWSPDGSRIAFSGGSGGYSDIYIYNLETDSLTNITQDRYSDLQPTWSPNGAKIAFASDRGRDTDFESLIFGNMKIVEYHLGTGQMRILPHFYDSKHIDPVYSPDGTSIYYVSDYEGFNNVYRYDFITGERYKITNVNTGVSGISEYSPAITVAQNTGDMIVTVFKKGNYNLYHIPGDELRGTQVINYAQVVNSKRLPPIDGGGNQITLTYLSNPERNLPLESSFGLSEYDPTLSLSYITGGAGLGYSNRLGVGAAGGITAVFSDLLNQRKLFLNLQIQGSFRDIGGQVGYLNTDNRFIYGGAVSHRTYRTAGAGVSATGDSVSIGGLIVPVLRFNRVTRRVFQNQASFLGSYPFSRTQRFETSLTYTRLSYDFELESSLILPNGRRLDRLSTQDLPTPDPLNLVNASLAYVEDNSLAAFTGPIKGHRMRLEVQPTTGSLSYVMALADYRRYFYARPFTFAFRALHSGRYFGDAEDSRLTPNYLGYETLVRGYNINSFSSQECTITSDGRCAEFSRLIGSKIAVANAEIRLPVLGLEQLALFSTRIIPTTFVAFFDAGVAWTSDELPDLRWATGRTTERVPVFSTGVSLRVNVLGFLVAEIYYAIPFQRPGTDGVFGFHIAPGW